MSFRSYMAVKNIQEDYALKKAPFDEKINYLIAERDANIRAINDKYNSLIESARETIVDLCGYPPHCSHEIQVMMKVIGIPATVEFPHEVLKECYYCLTCGTQIESLEMKKPYIEVGRPVDSSEAPAILQAMQAKVDELFSENPDMEMHDVRMALHEFVNGELEQNQTRK